MFVFVSLVSLSFDIELQNPATQHVDAPYLVDNRVGLNRVINLTGSIYCSCEKKLLLVATLSICKLFVYPCFIRVIALLHTQ